MGSDEQKAAMIVIADQLQVTPAQLASDIWTLAAWIESQGNKGYELSDLKPFAEHEATKLPIYFLKDDLEPLWKDMLFHAEGSRSKRRRWEASGWMVRKNPSWKVTWAALYGDLHPDRAAEVQAVEDEKRRVAAEEEARQKARLHERFPQGHFDLFSTLQIGQRMAIAYVLSERARHSYFASYDRPDLKPEPEPGEKKKPSRADEMNDSSERYIAAVWADEYDLMRGELLWREEYQGDEMATAILHQGVNYFFTKRTIKAWIDSSQSPTFPNGYAGQPYDAIEGIPIDRLSTSGVLTRFMLMVDPAWEHAGEYAEDDLNVITGVLRQQLKRLKTQG